MMVLSELPLTVILPACFLFGLLLGYVYFHALNETANLIVSDGSALLGIALTVGRLSLIGAAFYAAVLVGGFPLLAALAGFICTKYLVMWQKRKSNL